MVTSLPCRIRIVPADLGCEPERAVLKDLDVADAGLALGRRLADRVRLQESQLQNVPVPAGQPGQDPLDPLRRAGVLRRAIVLRGDLLDVDRGDLAAERAAP